MPEPEYYFRFESYEYQPQQSLRLLNRIKGDRPYINLILFLLTILTTYLVNGISYSISIVSILLAHEMGHYLMCRKYGIAATLPYFIPVPFAPFGTMGAFIKMKERIPDRRALFDVGVAGPLAGLTLTIPVLILGLKNSQFVRLDSLPGESLFLGESLLFSQLAKLILGTPPEGYDTALHPMAYAGWAGLFVTALNLLPIGQLDGGHVLYALFGHHSQRIFKLTMAAFIIVAAFFYPGWLVMIVLLLLLGFHHPAPENDYIQLDKKRRIIGYGTFVIFVVSFIPVPFYFR
ncbi:MAG: site-2 protease family protein [candidate division KSB1 bacterium]|nr:site-2 protease family protein [candidate division KSB1 bacterium]MDZ7335000.1 site-2 protease family protein [candidate division KSB1 bacterium]MDZ7375696.1 site-2 protease family protein [candidate division KSB1 bacterium]MDZ7400191.1 site-2 protease family protein [candidate division KSB1 bacterium]